MEQVPAIIGTKDLSYLTDIFEWNFVASKKALCYINATKNEEIQKQITKIYKMHTNILEKILNILD